VRRLRFKGPHFLISAVTRSGTSELAEKVMNFIESMNDTAASEKAASAKATAGGDA
jgi:hypothetical protein